MFLFIVVFILPLFYPSGISIYFRLFLLSLIFIESFKLFKIIFVDIKINKIISNLSTVLFSIFVTFILLEAIFMFISRSHTFDFTLGSKIWFSKYWKPINSLGFRDIEPSGNNPVILFVGNSFTAGHGLKYVDDRFSNIVGNELRRKGGKYTIINIGVNGLHPRGEYDLMRNFLYMTRIKPEKIIFQYSGNDIDEIAMNNGLRFSIPLPPDRLLMAIVSGSYLFNYIYWSFPREYISAAYTTFLTEAYKKKTLLLKQRADFELFVDYANENSIQLVVVVFPFLTDIEMSNLMYVNDIVNFFKANKISVINVSQMVKDIPVAERIINKNDSHASKKLNMMVAQEILKRLK